MASREKGGLNSKKNEGNPLDKGKGNAVTEEVPSKKN